MFDQITDNEFDIDLLDALKNVNWHKATLSETQSFSMALTHLSTAEQAHACYKTQAMETRWLMFGIFVFITVAGLLGVNGFSVASGTCIILLLKFIYDFMRTRGMKKIVELNKENLLTEIDAVVKRQNASEDSNQQRNV